MNRHQKFVLLARDSGAEHLPNDIDRPFADRVRLIFGSQPPIAHGADFVKEGLVGGWWGYN